MNSVSITAKLARIESMENNFSLRFTYGSNVGEYLKATYIDILLPKADFLQTDFIKNYEQMEGFEITIRPRLRAEFAPPRIFRAKGGFFGTTVQEVELAVFDLSGSEYFQVEGAPGQFTLQGKMTMIRPNSPIRSCVRLDTPDQIAQFVDAYDPETKAKLLSTLAYWTE